ncbi:MAG: hypothetical protein M9936_12520 [Caldilinea sp.]|nr:hypothetical protein [Caldilineaceae bacterium]MCO5210517.1 hypothetical protein [Caldilinea sp.]MCB9114645.1 hypothetical protein [Caldilineaceae bacterium]MCB9120251.1 hypothetical protein [Caldilineaceae bacterium]MCB9124083.1 hypothetical protein [Caldilineaceae bacterium]
MFKWFADVFDVTLLATIGLIFFATLVGAYVRARRRDQCLKAFIGYNVTVECADGKIIWGKMDLASTGLELRYANSVRDENHVESSYIMYADEFAGIQAIYRYIDELDEERREQRHKDLAQSLHPNAIRRTARNLRNFISLASESLSEVIGLIIGGLRKPAGRYITDTGEAHLKSLGSTVIGQVGGGYDPLLERYIGQKMVFEIVEDDEVHEHVGVFSQYSPDFFEILDVAFPQRKSVTVEHNGAIASDYVDAIFQHGKLSVTNRSDQMLLLQSLSTGEEEESINVLIGGGERVELKPDGDFQEARLNFRVIREVDMIVPRTRCLVRHRAEYYRAEVLPSIIFDLGIKLRGASKADIQERRLRRVLQKNPYAVLAMANLGALLMQQQEYEEAQQLLDRAWTMRNSLPDNGRRTRQLLLELNRRRAKTGQTAPAQPAMTPMQSQEFTAILTETRYEPSNDLPPH